MRKNIYDVLRSANISPKTEYTRLYNLMNDRNVLLSDNGCVSLYELAEYTCVYFDLKVSV